MLTVLSCEVFAHNVWLVLAAALVCVCGTWAQIGLYRRGLQADGLRQLGWQFLAANAAGASIWCTHFVAILAYNPGVPVGFDASLTIASSLLAVVGAGFAFFVSTRPWGRPMPAIGGALFGLAIAGMHYTGMMGYRVVGLVSWNATLVALSIVIAVAFGAASLHVVNFSRGPLRIVGSVGLLVIAIVGLHFVGMAAFRVAPLTLPLAETNSEAYSALALSVVGMTMLIVSGAVVSYVLDKDQRAESYSRLREMALHDPLTGLPNRLNFHGYLSRQLANAEKTGSQTALVVLDLNGFKEVNDHFGHSVGDEVLKTFATRLEACLEPNEFAARVGGDEFAIVRDMSKSKSLSGLFERLTSCFIERLSIGDYVGDVRASMGVAIYPDDAQDQETLIVNADLAMYRAKAERSDQPCFYERSMDERVHARRKLAAELRAAIANNELEVHYQKQASVDDGKTQGYEALARWPRATGGYVPPAEFIPLAEESGLIDDLGAWVLFTACKEVAQWTPPTKVAVNLSPLQLKKPNLVQRVSDTLRATGLPPERLELELTESAIVSDPVMTLNTIRALKALGVTIALDDFGTGHSSLSTLRAFPFDKIKLDRSFLWEIETDKQAKAILRAVLALGRSLNIAVLAEGIETEGQLQMLRKEECNQAQGYFLGRPAPMARLLAEGHIAVVSNSANERRDAGSLSAAA